MSGPRHHNSAGSAAVRRIELVGCALLLVLAACSKHVTSEPVDAADAGHRRSVEHRVATGETLTTVADNYYGDPDRAADIARENGLTDPQRLAPGSLLRLTFTAREWPEAQQRIDALEPYNRGVELLAQDDLPGAEEQFRLAVATAPEMVNARFNLAVVRLKRGDYNEAQELLAALVAERGDDPDFRYAYGHTLFLRADFDGAAAAFENLLERHPGHRRGTYGLARSYQEAGRRDDAIRTWRAYLAIDDTSSWADAARRNLRQLQSE